MGLLSMALMGLWLFLCGYQDWKEKEISVVLLAAGGIILPVVFWLAGGVSPMSRMEGLLLGLGLLLLGRVTKGQIGTGDGIILCITGLCLGLKGGLNLLLWGLILAAMASLILLLFKKAGRKDTIPFIPFLFLAYMGGILLP